MSEIKTKNRKWSFGYAPRPQLNTRYGFPFEELFKRSQTEPNTCLEIHDHNSVDTYKAGLIMSEKYNKVIKYSKRRMFENNRPITKIWVTVVDDEN